MGLFKKNPDPITDRSRELNAKIAALESKIKKLNQDLKPGASAKTRSSPPPADFSDAVHPETLKAQNIEPIFERVDQNQLKASPEAPATAQHFNEYGVRKYDLLSLFDRIRKQFQAPPAANPKLVSYLASGSIQGLRPLRYEKRVARNRFIALATLLLLAGLGIISYALRHHRP